MNCPECGTKCEPFATADIGVGVHDFGPWGCPACHWMEGPDVSDGPEFDGWEERSNDIP